MKRKVLSILICTSMVVSQLSAISALANTDSTETENTTTGSAVSANTSTTDASITAADASTTATDAAIQKIEPDIIVDGDYTGVDGDLTDGLPTYKTIKAAITSISSSNSAEKVIYVRDGSYKEKLTISSPNITLVGESADGTKITYDAANALPVKTEDQSSIKTSTYGTSGSATVTVTSNATNFKAANITFENSFDESDSSYTSSNKSAVAMKSEADHSVFYNCKFLGNQDTLYPNKNSQYFYKCYIEGDVDFIFGGAQAVFEKCEIHSLNRSGISPKGYVSAPSTLSAKNYGFLMYNCDLTSDSGMEGQVYLGRPWQPNYPSNYCRVAYKKCNLGNHIAADGWTTMSNTDKTASPNVSVTSYPADNFMYEYENTGDGANTSNSNRKQLTDTQANDYCKANVLSGWTYTDDADKLISRVGESETTPEINSDISTSTNSSTTTAESVTWNSTEFGASTSTERNTIDVDDKNKTVTISAGTQDGTKTGGKVTGSQDGMSYYYTVIDPSKNFELSADVKVNYFEKTSPDNQCGFGIMARDTIGTAGDASVSNSNMCLVGGYRAAVQSVFRNGVKDSSGIGATMEGVHKFADRPANDGTSTYKLKLRKTNTGYIASVDDGTEVTYYRPKQLEILDSNHIYLGFFAARVASITVSNINLTTSDVATDPAGEAEPAAAVTPAMVVASSNTSGSSSYNLDLNANVAGTVNVKQSGTEIYNGSITADTDLKIPSTLVKGDNTFDIIYTPSQDNATPISKTYTVTYKAYGDENGDIYVSSDGSANGTGTKDSPVDIYTATKYIGDGQTIKVKGGVYNLTSPITIAKDNCGSSSKMKTFTSYGGERAVFNFGKQSAGLTLLGSYWHLYGIDVTNTSDKEHGITVSGNNNVVENVKTYKNGDTGLQVSGDASDTIENWPSNNLILNCESYDNMDAAMNNADGFAAKLTVGYNNIFRGCISHNNCDDGWDLYTKSETGKIGAVTIEDCIAYGNGTLTDGTLTSGDGNGFKLGGEGIAITHTLKNSLAFNNNATGITSNSNPAIVVENSIGADNKKSNVGLDYYTNANLQFNLKNTISFRTATGVADSVPDKVLDDSNYFYNGQKTINKSGTEITSSYFKSTVMPSTVERDSDGNIIWPDYMNPVNGSITHTSTSGNTTTGDNNTTSNNTTSNTTTSNTTTSSNVTTSSSSHHHHHSSSDNNNSDTDTSSSTNSNNNNTNSNNSNSDAKKGWKHNADGTWSFVNSKGEKAFGWIKDGDRWYHLNSFGIMQTGWLKDTNGLWYYLNSDGSMKRGWLKDTNEKWYYLNDNGSMKTGWFKESNGKWYYFYNSGEMAVGTTIDGYEIDYSGVWVNN